jgi:hypothetical protein
LAVDELMAAKRFTKNPVEIEAIQFLDDDSAFEILKWIGQSCRVFFDPNGVIGIEIKTLEGDLVAAPGDYVIKGVKGEFYPCKPDIFAETYEEV